MNLNAKILAEITGGVALANFEVSSFVIDSRLVKPNDCFIAIVGTNNNGHDYIANVIEKNPSAIIVNKDYALKHDLKSNMDTFNNYLIVENTLIALDKIARYVRNSFNKTIIGITGSSGKTSLKEMVAFALSNSNNSNFNNFNVAKTEGNFNNHIGMPLCLANLSRENNVGVFEMGMSAKGEISYLTNILKPHIGIITGIASAHSEFFKSQSEIAQAKIEIIESMDEKSILILNKDDSYCDFFKREAQKKNIRNILYFSKLDSNADIFLEDYDFNFIDANSYGANINANILGQSVNFDLKSIASHNYMFFCIALAIVKLLEGDVNMVLSKSQNFELPKGRGKISWVVCNNKKIILIDDSYNANPLSMSVAIGNLQPIVNNKILILGEMLELGEDSVKHHIDMIKAVEKINYKAILCVGSLMKHLVNNLQNKDNVVSYFEDISKLYEHLVDIIQENDVVFIKGSYSSWVHKITDMLDGKK
jgi:UDP-N-acetylmuramoyl-tripeptide--D-alanyl-D-alanine ligase